MTKVVGIDFGTTNIRIAEWDAGSGKNPSSSQIGEGRLSYMPAVIGFRRQRGGEVETLFGETADSLDDARNVIVIRNTKRFALASDDYVRDQLESDIEQRGETWDTWFDPDSRSIRVLERDRPRRRSHQATSKGSHIPSGPCGRRGRMAGGLPGQQRPYVSQGPCSGTRRFGLPGSDRVDCGRTPLAACPWERDQLS